MISRLEVELSKELSTFQTVDESVYPWKRVSILYQNLVESPIVDDMDQVPSFFGTRTDRLP